MKRLDITEYHTGCSTIIAFSDHGNLALSWGHPVRNRFSYEHFALGAVSINTEE